MIYLGADPGIDGAIAAIVDNGEVVLCQVVPTVPTGKGSRRDYDMDGIKAMFAFVSARGDELRGAVERQHAFPSVFGGRKGKCPACGQPTNKGAGMKGSIANFKQGSAMRLWTDALFWNSVPDPVIVDARTWQSYFGIKGKRQGQEAPSIAVARELFPCVDLRRSTRGRVDHAGMADALLIAEWCRRMNGGDDF